MPSIQRLVLCLFAMMLAAGLALAPSAVQDPDLWWHLRTGDWITANGAVPGSDPFSTQGSHPWLAYTWAFDVIIHAMYQAGGGTAICLLVAIICASVALWIVTAGVRNGHSPDAVGVLLVVAMLALTGYATPRPWWASVAGVIAVLELVRRWEWQRNPRVVWMVPLVFVVWANLHIQFLYGLALLGWWLVTTWMRGESARTPAVCLVGAIAATLANPYGAGLYFQGLEYARHASLRQYVEELRPPDFSEPYMVFVMIAGAVALAVLLVRRPRPVSWLSGLWLMGVILFLRSRRDGWMLVLASVWVLVESLPALRWQAGAALRVTAVAVGVGLFFSGLWRVRPDAVQSALASTYSVQAVRHLPASGNIFTPFDWGGYVLWAHPSTKVTFDGRTNVHGVDRTMRLFQVWSGERPWRSEEELLSAAAILAPAGSPLAVQLRKSPEYRVAYEDAVAAVFVPSADR